MKCRGVYSNPWLGLVALIDIISCVVNLLMFIIPLRKVIYMMNKEFEEEFAQNINHHSQSSQQSFESSKSLKSPK